MEKKNWLDLSTYGAEALVIRLLQKRGYYVIKGLDPSSVEAKAVLSIKRSDGEPFFEAKGGGLLVCPANFVPLTKIHEALPNATITQEAPRSVYFQDAIAQDQKIEDEGQFNEAQFAAVSPVGTNYHGDTVLVTPFTRAVKRVNKQGQTHIIYEDQVNDPAAFFRKPSNTALVPEFLKKVSQGFLRAMDQGQKLRTSALVRVVEAIEGTKLSTANAFSDPTARTLVNIIRNEIAIRAFEKETRSEAEAEARFEKTRSMYELAPELFVDGVLNQTRKQEPMPAPLLSALANALEVTDKHNVVMYAPVTQTLPALAKKAGGLVVFTSKESAEFEPVIRSAAPNAQVIRDRGYRQSFEDSSKADLVFVETEYTFNSTPIGRGDFSSNRGEFLYAIKALDDKKDEGIAVLSIPSTDSVVGFREPNLRVKENTKTSDLINYIGQRYEILASGELHHERIAKIGRTFSNALLVVGKKRPEMKLDFNPRTDIAIRENETIASWEALDRWTSSLKTKVEKEGLLRVKNTEPTEEEIAQARELQQQRAEQERIKREERAKKAVEKRAEKERKIIELGASAATEAEDKPKIEDAVIDEVAAETVATSGLDSTVNIEVDDEATDAAEELTLGSETKIDPFKERRIAALEDAKTTSYEDVVAGFRLEESFEKMIADVVFDSAFLKIDENDENLLDRGRKQNKQESGYQAPAALLTKLKEPTKMIPRNLVGPMTKSSDRLAKKVGDIDRFLAVKLSMAESELAEIFSGEQIQQIASAIVRVESGRGFIVGSQTGTGKGRIIAAMIRYAILQKKPTMFVTEGAHLFSDLYRDLRDIKSDHMIRNVMIMNDNKIADVRDDIDGKLIIKRDPKVLDSLLAKANIEGEDSSLLGNGIDLAFSTYSQFRSKDSPKSSWMATKAMPGSMLILDESHNAAGNSNTGIVMRKAVASSAGAVHSSATYSKNAQSMGTYSTVFPPEMSVEEIQQTLRDGGEPMAEIVAGMLASDGGFIRYEHDFSKLKITNKIDHENLERNADLADQFSDILREINRASGSLGSMTEKLEQRYSLEHARLPEHLRANVGSTSLESTGFGSAMFNLQRVFALVLKADKVADLAIEALRNDQKPVIVLEQTQEAAVEQSKKAYLSAKENGDVPDEDMFDDVLLDASGNELPPLEEGEVDMKRGVRIPVVTLRNSLLKAFRNATTVKRKLGDGTTEILTLAQVIAEDPKSTPQDVADVEAWEDRVMAMIYDLPDLDLVPIDYVKHKIRAAGYSVGEVTGRKYEADFEVDANGERNLLLRRRPDMRQEDVRSFNAGTTSALVINIAGASGISVHSNALFANKNQRVLIEWQIAQDVNKRIQLFGRINREGQVCDPEVWTVGTGLPFEMRQNSMQLAKLRTLSANTQGNRRNVVEEAANLDLMNVVGNESAKEFLLNHPEIVDLLSIDMNKLERSTDSIAYINKLSFLMSLLYVEEQMHVFEELEKDFEARLRDMEMQGESPLAAKEFNWKAKTVKETLFLGEEKEAYESAFDTPVYARTLEFEEYKNPMRWERVEQMIAHGKEAWSKRFGDEDFKATRSLDLVNDFKERLDRVIMNSIPDRYFPVDKDRNDDEVKQKALQDALNAYGGLPSIISLNNRKKYAADIVRHIYPGATIALKVGMFSENYIVTEVNLPPKGNETQFNRYVVKMAKPDEQKVTSISLSMMFSGGYNVEPVEKLVESEDEISNQEAFDRIPAGVQKETRVVLAGNLFRALSESNGVESGTVGVYTDENGVRQNAIIMRKGMTETSLNMMSYTASVERARAIAEVMPGAEITFFTSSHGDPLTVRRTAFDFDGVAGQARVAVAFTQSGRKDNWSKNKDLMKLLRSEGNIGGYKNERYVTLKDEKIYAIIDQIKDSTGKAIINRVSRDEISLMSAEIDRVVERNRAQAAEAERTAQAAGPQQDEGDHLEDEDELEQPEVQAQLPTARQQNNRNNDGPALPRVA